MKFSTQKKWFIKETSPAINKKTPLTINTPERAGVYSNLLFLQNQQNDIQAVCSSRTTKKKVGPASKQTRPPSAEIVQRSAQNPVGGNPLSLSSKLKNKPMIYNLTSPKIKVKTPGNNGNNATQKGFLQLNTSSASKTFSHKLVVPKEPVDTEVGRSVEQSSKSTQYVNEISTKSIHQLNETTMTIKAENPENSTKNIPLISPANNMMRRLTLNEKDRFFSTNNGNVPLSAATGSKPSNASVRSHSQTQKNGPFCEINNEVVNENSVNKSKEKEGNALQKISKLVSEIHDLENKGGDYDSLKSCVLQLEQKITDLKCSIELKKPTLKMSTENGNSNKENKLMIPKESNLKENSDSNLNGFVTSVSPLVRNEPKKSIALQNFLNSKHLYPKSTTNADLNRRKFEFQNKPPSVKIQNINPEEELVCEELQFREKTPNNEKNLPNSIFKEGNNYYVENAVNSFYRPLNFFSDPCEDNYFTQLCQEHMSQTFHSLQLCKSIINNSDNHNYYEKSINLPDIPNKVNKKTLIFDLDETLVHCNESLELPADVVLPIIFPNGQKIEAGINIRPYTRECLKELSQLFEIVVFTASHSCYANVVLDYLDEKKELIHHRMYREHCIGTKEGVFIKDLRIINNRKPENMIIVDNAAYSFAFQMDNGIPILPFYDFKSDNELLTLTYYLKTLAEVPDVREVNKNFFKFSQFEKYSEMQDLIEGEFKSKIARI